MKHIVSFSGGVGSYMAAKRVAERYGTADLLLVFTDTKSEDEDLYRFLGEAVADIGGEYVYLAEGRDIWQVFFDQRYIGNSRGANCTRTLKQEIFRKWLNDSYGPDECIVYLGIDWSEIHRFERAKPHWVPYTIAAPMCEEPYLDKQQMFAALEAAGIKKPRLYDYGFAHNNCSGFCVKAGHGQFKQLLEKMPDRYAYHERKEQEFREYVGKDVSVLRDRRGGTTKPLTLKALRERVQGGQSSLLDLDDFGGCGCFLE